MAKTKKIETINWAMYPSIEHIKNVTSFKTDKLARGAISALNWLERGAPHTIKGLKGKFEFDMEEFIHFNDDLLNTCKTSQCIAGAIHQFSTPENIDYSLGYGDIIDIFGNDAANHGLSSQSQLAKLFYPAKLDEEGFDTGDIARKSPEEAATALRGYLETGITQWPE